MAKARYAIGIDLGTTNCTLAYVDLEANAAPRPELLSIPQWEGEGQLGSSTKLPSFVWFMPKALVKREERRLPWHATDARVQLVLGREAKFRALKEPDRVAFAAKSWLSVGAPSTRQAKILPWGSASLTGEERLSPVGVQKLLLEHMAAAWNVQFALGDDPQPLHEQHLVITVPASFDDLAQTLTLDAAAQAGFPASTELLEEPQAAFYDWFSLAAKQLSGAAEKLVLVCDIGGGTSDFTLLRVEKDGSKISRLRVSEHLLLGGDNIDLSLAEHFRQQLLGSAEAPRSAWQLLLAQARQLKEEVLSQSKDASENEASSQGEETLYHVSLPTSQTQNLFGSYASASISRRALKNLIIEGFFPAVEATAKPRRPETGLRSFGLPFVQDTAVTRHLAAFLQGTKIDALLCAGGSLAPTFLQRHLCDVLQSWQPQHPIELLDHSEPDLAIARGAAWYGWQRYHGTQLVESRYPRSLYLELASEEDPASQRYLCLVPRGQPRSEIARLEVPGLGLHLRVGQVVSFRLFSSLDEALPPSEALALREPLPSWQALPTMTTEISLGTSAKAGAGKQALVPVALEALVRETGVLELSCRSLTDPDQSWRLSFALEGAEAAMPSAQEERAVSGLELRDPASEPTRIKAAIELLQKAFGKAGGNDGIKPEQLPKQLEELLGSPRDKWPLATLRQLWEPLREGMHRRQRSAEHESSWLYLAGFCLRPGWGAPRDPERIKQLWPLFDHGWNKAFPEDRRLENQWWLLWRRVAGGLNAQQQSRILDKLLPQLRKDGGASPEMIRLAAALERAPMDKKLQTGRVFAQQISSGQKDLLDARIWSLARISSRYPLAAGPEAVVPPHAVEEWADLLKALPWPAKTYQRLGLFYQLAGRLRGEKALDIDPAYREDFLERLKQSGAEAEALAALTEVQKRTVALDQQLFGESLPAGLVLRS